MIGDRTRLNFEENARKSFAFLLKNGFRLDASSMYAVRFKRGDLEVEIFHDRLSYEIGAGFDFRGERYSLSEIIRNANPQYADEFLNPMMTTPEGVVSGLETIRACVMKFGGQALDGDSRFFETLDRQREQWKKAYELEVLSENLKPKADLAFREGDYATAFNLYSRIRDALDSTGLKKLDIARKRRYK